MNIVSKFVEVHIYRINKEKIEFLALKRSETMIYPFTWQPVTGKIETNEKAYEAGKREVLEETNNKPIRFWTVPIVSSFYLKSSDEINQLPVFAAELPYDCTIKICSEHTEYKWINSDEAFQMYIWRGQKEAIKVIEDMLLNNNSAIKFSEINSL